MLPIEVPYHGSDTRSLRSAHPHPSQAHRTATDIQSSSCVLNSVQRSLLFPVRSEDLAAFGETCSARPDFRSSRILETNFTVQRKRRLLHNEDEGCRLLCQSLSEKLPKCQRRQQEDPGSYCKATIAELASRKEKAQVVAETRRRREVERIKFRLALDGMQKTVDIDENKAIASFLRRQVSRGFVRVAAVGLC